MARRKFASPTNPRKRQTKATFSAKDSALRTAGPKAISTLPDVPSAHFTTTSAESGRDGELLQVHSLLAQIWHRNKNQHRGQEWWKWLSVLKRGVRDSVELARPEDVRPARRKRRDEDAPSGEAARARMRMERDRVKRERREQVAGWLREVVLGKCWL